MADPNESKAVFTLKSWIRQLQALLGIGAEQQIKEINQILEAAFTYKEEVETMSLKYNPAENKCFVTVEIPKPGVALTVKQAKMVVRGVDGATILETHVVTENVGGELTVVMSQEQAEIISRLMANDEPDVKCPSDEDYPEFVSNEKANSIEAKARMFADGMMSAKSTDQKVHVARWNEYRTTLTSSEYAMAYTAYNKRVEELAEVEARKKQDLGRKYVSADVEPDVFSETDIRETAIQLAEDLSNADSDQKHIHVDRWNTYYGTLNGAERRTASAIYNKRLGELA